MNLSAKIIVLCLSSLTGIGVSFAEQVNDDRLISARTDKENWMTYGRDYTNQRFSPLKQINTQNIKQIVPKWIYQTGHAASFQTMPLVVDGIMYLTTPFSHVTAVDARTGTEIWRYHHKSRAKKHCCGPANQGAAIAYGKVFVATIDARLVALDKKSGQVIWDKTLAESDGTPTETIASLGDNDALRGQKTFGSTGVGARMAPLVYQGQVIVGITGVGYSLHLEVERPGAPVTAVVGISGRYGRPGFIASFNAQNGERNWQFDTTKEGWEGSYATETRFGQKLDRNIDAEKAAAPKNPEAWKFGGGAVWSTPAVDHDRGVIFFGIGNPSPQAAGEGRPGDNLYTTSLVALEAKTGKLVWYYQYVPHDIWGYDVASPPTLFDIEFDGETVPAVGHASKLGWYFVHDRRDGKLLFRSDAFVPQDNMFAIPTNAGIRITPGPGGGSNWSPTSLDEVNGRVYVAGVHLPWIYRKNTIPATADRPPLVYYAMEPAEEPNWGTLTAIDLNKKGKIAWQHRTTKPLVGGVLATAGGLVFTGQGTGEFSAFDALSGQEKWYFMTGAGINAPPMTYMLDGKQHIAIAVGGTEMWRNRRGGAVVVFGLTDEELKKKAASK